MQKGVQTRRSVHIILCALKNNTDVFEEIINILLNIDIHLEILI